MIKILTIEREYGSGAAEIGKKLADRLGWKLWDQSLTDEIARRMECDTEHIEKHGEQIDPLFYRLLKSFLRGSLEGNLNIPQMQMADAEGVRRVAEQLVMEAANEGNAVIVGRGSAYYLRNRLDSFHVFVYAPFEERVRRLQQAGKSEAESIQLADTVDRDRAEFIKQYFGIEWPARHFFHLMINFTMGGTAVVQMVLDCLIIQKDRARRRVHGAEPIFSCKRARSSHGTVQPPETRSFVTIPQVGGLNHQKGASELAKSRSQRAAIETRIEFPTSTVT
jgi:cytidylate kinase